MSVFSNLWSNVTNAVGSLFGKSSSSNNTQTVTVNNMDWSSLFNTAIELATQIMPYYYTQEASERSIEANKESQALQYQYNSQLQENAQNWMENMSSTAHQREVADLRSAGLNPILSAGGNGASTTTSGASSIGMSDNGQQIMAGVASAIQMGQLNLQKKAVANEIAYRNAEIEKINTETELNLQERTRKIIENMNLPTYYKKQFENMEAQTLFNRASASAVQTTARAQMMKAEVDKYLSTAQQKEINANTKYKKGLTHLLGKDKGESHDFAHEIWTPVFKTSMKKGKSYTRY